MERTRREERRAFARWPAALQGQCYGPWGSSQCLVTEVSEAGITVLWGHEARVGDEMTVAFWLDDGLPLHITCHVRRISRPGAGLEFLDATLSDRLRIVTFLSARAKAV